MNQTYFYLFFIALLFFISFFTIYAGIYGAASIPVQKKIAKKMADSIKIKKGRIYYDLGSGDGRILKQVAYKKGIAIGFEYAPLTYLLSKMLLLLKNNKKVKIFWKNFYKVNLKNASCVFCYLSSGAMNRLESKFKKELTKGAKVVSYVFKLPNKKPEKIIKTKSYAPIYIYRY